jgi:two-component system, chemotaxis family, chemotaxis protein CheY
MGDINFQGIAVLVVDDNQPMRQLLKAMLRSFGISSLFEAGTVERGYQIFQQEEIDFVLTDIKMEPVGGLELLAMIRNQQKSRDPYVPVIIITGFAQPDYVQQALDGGMHEFMVKPITAENLRKRMTSILESPRAFVHGEEYFGPERRRRDAPAPQPDRRGTA